MRIIGGKHRSRKIDFIESEFVRPTADMVRQAVFTKIQFDISGCTFLDLFAGSGSVGLEALSRNAKQVFFVDKNKYCCDIVKQNLKTLNETANVFNLDFENFLLSTNETFDIIYIDPPYKSNFYNRALTLILERNLLKDDGMIICECDNLIPLEQNSFKEMDKRKYGKKCVYFLKKQ